FSIGVVIAIAVASNALFSSLNFKEWKRKGWERQSKEWDCEESGYCILQEGNEFINVDSIPINDDRHKFRKKNKQCVHREQCVHQDAFQGRRNRIGFCLEGGASGSSNRVASNMVKEEVVDPRKVKMVMNMSNGMPCYMLPVEKKSKGVELVTLDVAEEEVVGSGGVNMLMNEIEGRGRSSGQDHLDYKGE
ncbi:hypothetical protein Tco_0442447, partial [Tanacetum coccineum]